MSICTKKVEKEFNGETITIKTTRVNPSEKWDVIVVDRSSTKGSRDKLEKVKDYNDLDTLIRNCIEGAYDEPVDVSDELIDSVKKAFEK